MPWTFAHPAAVLPLRSLAANRLSLAALIIGSIVPDLGYYVGRFDLANMAHAPLGLILVCLPTGIAALALIRALRRPLCYLLPQPHRGALASLPQVPLLGSTVSARKVTLSLLLGALTHIAWDSFTHATGWAVTNLPALHASILVGSNANFPVFNALQHVSTALGLSVIYVAYSRWLSTVPKQQIAQAQESERWRWILLAGLALVSSLAATVVAYKMSVSPTGAISFQSFIFRSVVFATSAFAASLTIASLLVAWGRAVVPPEP